MSVMQNAQADSLSVGTSDFARSNFHNTGQSASLTFEQAASLVLGTLQKSLQELLTSTPANIDKAIDVERVFEVDRRLGWRLYRVAYAKSPLAAGPHVPARVSMKRLFAAAEKRGVPNHTVESVAAAFDAFEQFVESDAGSREELEAMLNALLPGERYKQEIANREAAFRANSQVWGIANAADIITLIFHLSADGSAVDRITSNVVMGLRRSRKDVPVVIGMGNDPASSANQILPLNGQEQQGPLGCLLPEFSTSPFPNFDIRVTPKSIYYCIANQDVGLRSAADVTIVDRRPKSMPRYRENDSPAVRGPFYNSTAPAQHLTMDVFFHRDVYASAQPELQVHNTAARGPVSVFGDPDRELDVLYTHDIIRALPSRLAGASLPQMPRYVELLQHIFTTQGWNVADFRGYRLDVEYPIYGAQYRVGFRLPERPK